MKVALFSMFDCYGAGAAAYRLHEALRERGIGSSLFVGQKTREHSIALGAPAQGYLLVQDIYRNTAYGNTFSALHFGIGACELEEAVRDADIVCIHWASNFLSLDNIRRLIYMGKPVVITMHDENLYTGGCHYRHGCGKYLQACEECPQMLGIPGLAAEILADKINRFPQEAVIVTPSKWLASLASSSQVLPNNKVEVIPNGIDPQVFDPSLREAARRRYGYDDSRFVVLFGCQLLKDERKGILYLLHAMEQLRGDDIFRQIEFVCFGGDDADLPDDVRRFGYVEDERELASLYAMADAVIVPSLEDNLPNILLESLMSGTPVIGFSIGGIPDAIIDGKNGLLVPPRDAMALASAMKTMVGSDRGMRDFCRQDAKARYGMQTMADRYVALFRSVGPAAARPGAFSDDSIWQRAIKAEASQRAAFEKKSGELSTWLENERKYAGLYDAAYKVIARESQIRPVAIYGYGAWGRHIADVAGGWITFIVDQKAVDNEKYRAPSQLAELKKAGAFILICVTDDKELIENVDEAGFSHMQNYICINDLWS